MRIVLTVLIYIAVCIASYSFGFCIGLKKGASEFCNSATAAMLVLDKDLFHRWIKFMNAVKGKSQDDLMKMAKDNMNDNMTYGSSDIDFDNVSSGSSDTEV